MNSVVSNSLTLNNRNSDSIRVTVNGDSSNISTTYIFTAFQMMKQFGGR